MLTGYSSSSRPARVIVVGSRYYYLAFGFLFLGGLALVGMAGMGMGIGMGMGMMSVRPSNFLPSSSTIFEKEDAKLGDLDDDKSPPPENNKTALRRHKRVDELSSSSSSSS
jgi:hypothetical protein